jgi:hypothetical protein
MIYNGKEVEFPAIMQVSFFKLIETLEQQLKGDDEAAAAYAKALLKEVEKHPELRDGISDLSHLKKLDKSVRMMSRAMFPDALTTNEIKIITPPFYFEPFYTSTRFDNIIKASGEDFEFTMKDVDEDTFYLYCCYFILGQYYHFPFSGGGTPQFLEFFNKKTELLRTYKMLVNVEMCEFIPTEKAINISQADFEVLIRNFDDIKLWKEKFPPNSWIMRGVNILSLADVTTDQSIGSITSNLLVKSTDTFDKIQQGIRGLLNNNKLSIGILKLEDGALFPMDQDEVKSALLDSGETLKCETDMCRNTVEQIVHKKEPLVVSDTEYFDKIQNSKLSKKILKSGFLSYMLLPIIHEEEFLGFMEIGSQNKFEIHSGMLNTMAGILPILAMAHKRFLTEVQNQIEAVIQQECTTIHPSVKWRFEEEAAKFITAQEDGDNPGFKDIVFNNLYPLYGQLDIKGSSERRNKAVSADLIKQLKGIEKVLKAALKLYKLPSYEELIYRTESFIRILKKELAAGSEHTILAFLNSDVYPIFDYLRKKDEGLKDLIEGYEAIIDPDIKTVYDERKKYDNGVNLINQRLANYLDKRQVEAQAMFPHYFERYKTDGVEFNMYIGQSIAQNETFDDIFLKNIRLWQLQVICEMENEFKHIQKELDSSIEVASLILVYNTPISVHFRMDEKQFDVEGAYNARYEIIKKRVDKAHIKGTNERVTQPGKLVIVYSQEQDVLEYRTYLNFLTAKGYLKEGVEDVALEDLQGVHGLRALRAEVAYSSGLTIDELMKEIDVKVED